MFDQLITKRHSLIKDLFHLLSLSINNTYVDYIEAFVWLASGIVRVLVVRWVTKDVEVREDSFVPIE